METSTAKFSVEEPIETSQKKTSYSEAEREEFRSLLNQKLDHELSNLKRIKDSLASFGDSDLSDDKKNNFDFSGEGSSKDLLRREKEKSESFILNLQNAIQRTFSPRFGICRLTGVLIPKERLIAVPHATTTASAKEAESVVAKNGRRPVR